MYSTIATSQEKEKLPEGFVYVDELIPNIEIDLKYCTEQNFVGEQIDGYLRPRCILTKEAADRLKNVQEELERFGLGLKIYDAYRPQQAVDHFVRWGRDLTDTTTKEEFYPGIRKEDLFKEKYIAAKSSHTRGSTVDVTIVVFQEGKPGVELDMGSEFDFFWSKVMARVCWYLSKSTNTSYVTADCDAK